MLLQNEFLKIEFTIQDEQIKITDISFLNKTYVSCTNGIPLTVLYLTGGAYTTGNFNKHVEQGEKLKFGDTETVEKEKEINLHIFEYNDKVEVESIFTVYKDFPLFSVRKKITNKCGEKINIECASPLTLYGVMTKIGDLTLPYFYQPNNTHDAEALFEKIDLDKSVFKGYGRPRFERKGRYSITSNGTQTTNTYLPICIMQKQNYGTLYGELSVNGGWHYELATRYDGLAISFTNKTLADNGWYVTLCNGESYETESVRLTASDDVDGVLKTMTKYRRYVHRKMQFTVCENVVYNEFMENAYDHPTKQLSSECSTEVARYCNDVYVVDAGWHDGKKENVSPTLEIGNWEENLRNYPDGFYKTVEEIKSKNLKFGLWLEVQSIGIFHEGNNIPEDWYFHLNGTRVGCHGRYQLNFAKEEVRDYTTKLIDRIIEKYQPEYIKVDYNQTVNSCDCENGSFSQGVSLHCKAYRKWFEKIQDKYPNVIFESCSSGGMCSDAENMAITSVMSFSDMEVYYTAPYTVANQVLALLPEQTGVWCTPVALRSPDTTTDEQVAMSVTNSLLGVINLSSKLQFLNETQREILRQGIAYYKKLAKDKVKSYPVLPNGIISVDDDIVVRGLITEDKLYLVVNNMSVEEKEVEQDLSKYSVINAKLTYPEFATEKYVLKGGTLSVTLQPMTSRVFEMEIK